MKSQSLAGRLPRASQRAHGPHVESAGCLERRHAATHRIERGQIGLALGPTGQAILSRPLEWDMAVEDQYRDEVLFRVR